MENESGTGRRSKLRMGAILATVATLVGIATGVLTLRDQIFGDDEPGPQPAGDGPGPREIASFDGVVGNFAESRAILDFLEQHDREPVYLDIGFPDHATGPAGGDNVVSKEEPFQGGTAYRVESVVLITECSSGVQIDPASPPTVADGCQGTSLQIDGPETTDSNTFFEHGVPRMKGHFQVDVTGALYQGISPIQLTPLTEEKAKERAS